MKNNRRTIQFRRKREGKTNYKKRINLLKARKERFVIRRFSGNMVLQLIKYDSVGDKILLTTSTKELQKFGWKFHKGNIPSAYLAGYLCGTKAKKMKIKEAILDIGLHKSQKGGRIFAAAKGAIDAGLNINCSEEVFPKEDRIKGTHIQTYHKKMEEEKESKQFSNYKKSKIITEDIGKMIESIKQNIDKEGAKA